MIYQDHLDYPTGRAQLLALYAGVERAAARYQAMGAWALQRLDAAADGAVRHMRHRYRIRSEAPLPAFARKLAGESSVVTQEERWDLEAGTGRVDIEVSGVPARITAELQLIDTADGCELRRQWTVNCRLPLIGGAVERLIVADIRGKSAHERAACCTLLAS